MTPEEIQAMAKGLAEGQAIWYVLSGCIGGLITGTVSYLAEKSKNRATKEDIAEITGKVKAVENVFNRGLADLTAHHQRRIVAADRRLQAHQEAYTLWDKLMITVHKDENDAQIAAYACQEWYNKNCIFLGPRSRDAFMRAYFAAPKHPELKRSRDQESVEKNWAILIAPLDILFEEVALPPMSHDVLDMQANIAREKTSPQ